MLISEQVFDMPIPKMYATGTLRSRICSRLTPDEIPVRVSVVSSNDTTWTCEVGVLKGLADWWYDGVTQGTIFNYADRSGENTSSFNTVLVIPTGIGAAIGGHAGDAGPIARLLAGACDTLITHPNVVNGSDINELPENGLYVEGSVLARLLMGTVGLRRVRSNRVLLLIGESQDRQIAENTINAVSAARATLGLDCVGVVTARPELIMQSEYTMSGRAVGRVADVEGVCSVMYKRIQGYDAVGIATVVGAPKGLQDEYFEVGSDIVNPWGGVEAMLTHTLSMLFNVPTAHAPMEESIDASNKHFGVVDPRKAAEVVSTCFLHCVLKGLHKSPKIVTHSVEMSEPDVLTASNVSCLVIPDGCIGLPTLAAMQQEIPVIAVRENTNLMENDLTKLPWKSGKFFLVDTYLEAVGVMAAIRSGVSVSSVRRPLLPTYIQRTYVGD